MQNWVKRESWRGHMTYFSNCVTPPYLHNAGSQPQLKSWGGPRFGSRFAPSQRPGWVLGAKGGRPLPLWGSGGVTAGKFLKTQMLNPAFWWHLLWNILLFENYGQEVGRPIHCWSPQPKSWGTSLPRSLRLLRLCQNGWSKKLQILHAHSHERH